MGFKESVYPVSERVADMSFLVNNLLDILRDDHHILPYVDAMSIAHRLETTASQIRTWHEQALTKGLD